MSAKFCAVDGCHEVAIAAARSLDHCRADYRTLFLDPATDLVTCEVTAGDGTRGEMAGVTDCYTNQTVHHGGTVTLDPRETNIAALVAGGTVKVVPAATKTQNTEG